MKQLIISVFFLLLDPLKIVAQPINKNSNNNVDYCSYFPLKNGLKVTYKRNNMMGEQTITETYTAVKDKVLKSGKSIKGYKINSNDENRNSTIIYYYCDAGSMKMYSEMPNYNTSMKGYVEDYSGLPSDYNKPEYQKTPIYETEKTGSGKYLSFTELKAINVGEKWTDVQFVNGNTVIVESVIAEDNLSIESNGQSYSPVIHVHRTVSLDFSGSKQVLSNQEIYYAKGIGKVKVVEEGNDMLMGKYTTTQELVSHNFTVQSNNSGLGSKVPTSNANQGSSKISTKISSEAAIAEVCDKWCGSYKLVEKDGQPVGDFPYGDYLHLETEGDAIAITLQKKSGKLYDIGKETPMEWTVWMENNQQVIYLRTAKETKGKPFKSNSIPRKKIYIENKVYEFVVRELQYY